MSERIIQERLREDPDILEERLFILAEEYSDWEDSNRRIDLLALDRKGRLVVVELKRSDKQSMMDLQAIRYSRFGSKHVVGSSSQRTPRIS